MEEGMAIETKDHPRHHPAAQKSRGAQLLSRRPCSYDEVMDYQRTSFYGMRQQVLEGRRVDKVIWKMIGDAIRYARGRQVTFTQDFVRRHPASEAGADDFESISDPPGPAMAGATTRTWSSTSRPGADPGGKRPGSTREEYLGEVPDDKATWD